MATQRQLKSEKMRSKHAKALRHFNEAQGADNQQRNHGLEDIYFAHVEDKQWDDFAIKRRKGRPRYTINKIAPALREVESDYKQNRVELTTIPKNDDAKEVNDTMQGLVRHIMNTQEAMLAKDNAFSYTAAAGMAGWRIVTKYEDEESFDQMIEIEPIWQPLNSMWLDPFGKHPFGKDSRYGFVIADWDKEVFEAKYPEASTASFDDPTLKRLQQAWYPSNAEKVRVAEYFVREPFKREVVRLSDGRVIDATKFAETELQLASEGIRALKRKTVKDFKVIRYKMNGSQMLEEPREIPSKYIPLVRCLGYYKWIDSRLYWHGLVRNSRDSQRLYNYAVSAGIEITALAPKNKILATPAMTKGFEREFAGINVSNSPVVRFNPDPKFPNGPKELSFSQSPNAALVQQQQQAELDIQATIGRRAPAQGEAPSDRSGRAILALQRQSDQSTFTLMDNIAQAEKYTGEILLDMIPRVIDTERQLRILGMDEQEEIVTVNQTVIDPQTHEKVIVNDLAQGKFDIQAKVGPAFESKRSEAINILSTLAENPQMAPMLTDLIAKNLDFPFAEELEKRIRKTMIAQGIVTPTEEEAEELAPSQEQQQQAQAQQQIQMMVMAEQLRGLKLQNDNFQVNIDKINADTQLKIQSAGKEDAGIEKTYADAYKSLVDSIAKKAESGIPFTQQEAEAAEGILIALNNSLSEGQLNLIRQNLSNLQNQ